MWLLEPSVTVEQRCYAGILDLITGAVDDQRRAGHVAELMNDGPVLERAYHNKLIDSSLVAFTCTGPRAPPSTAGTTQCCSSERGA